MQRIANRLGRARPMTQQPPREEIGPPEFWGQYDLPMPARVDKFCEELARLGGSAIVCDHTDDLVQRLAATLSSLAPGAVGIWGGDFARRWGLESILETYTCVRWEPQDRVGAQSTTLYRAFAAVDVGITGCDYAIADTGSVVLTCDPLRGRSVSLLPSVHIVLVRRSQIRTRLGEVLEELLPPARRPLEPPSSIHVISGPSRSSDIENDLCIGVHGPASVIAMIAP